MSGEGSLWRAPAAALTALVLAAGLAACGEGEDSGSAGHQDSGGGSAQYRVKGGDNSIQEFGEEASASERAAAAAVLHDFLDARAAEAWAAACEYVSAEIAETFEELAAQTRRLKGKSCGEVFEDVTSLAARETLREEAEQADVGSLRTDGERTFLLYSGAEGTVLVMPMREEGGAWKVASLAGTPLS